MHALRSQLFDASKLSSKIALGICGLAVAAVAVFAYFKEPSSSALATAVTAEEDATKANDLDAETLALAQLDSSLNSPPDGPSDRVLFDEGTDNAKNSRWVPMMRNFCAIPSDSTYFAPAEKQLTQWITLYKEDIAIALNTVIQEQNKDCEIINDLLTPPVE